MFKASEDVVSKIDMSKPGSDAEVMAIWDTIPESSKAKKFKTVLAHFSSRPSVDVSSSHADSSSQTISGSEDSSSRFATGWTIIDFKPGKSQTFCICSQNITNVYLIRNIHNGNILRVGTECINKTMTEETCQDAKALAKQTRYQGDKRMCVGCLKYVIPKTQDKWKTKCLKCFRKDPEKKAGIFAKGRECTKCHRLTIAPEEPLWKTKCLPCYLLTQNRRRY